MKTDTKATLVALTLVAVAWVLLFATDVLGKEFPEEFSNKQADIIEKDSNTYYLVCRLPNNTLRYWKSQKRKDFVIKPWGAGVKDNNGNWLVVFTSGSNCVKLYSKFQYEKYFLGKN